MKDLTLSILQVHNSILNASNHWIIAEVIMIWIESNNPKSNKLRVINKIETGYNLVIKYHWPHQTTHCTEKNLKTNGTAAQNEVQSQPPF